MVRLPAWLLWWSDSGLERKSPNIMLLQLEDTVRVRAETRMRRADHAGSMKSARCSATYRILTRPSGAVSSSRQTQTWLRAPHKRKYERDVGRREIKSRKENNCTCELWNEKRNKKTCTPVHPSRRGGPSVVSARRERNNERHGELIARCVGTCWSQRSRAYMGIYGRCTGGARCEWRRTYIPENIPHTKPPRGSSRRRASSITLSPGKREIMAA
ncbi:hypothetical protein C8R45DRAFT_494632 [Mycena sanguinolenta]|nr:hypothetical protein C8R45DRAFT_494632 [Mycena sanguinolenta]